MSVVTEQRRGPSTVDVMVYGHVIGTASQVVGGLLPTGRRKLSATLHDAALSILEGQVKTAQALLSEKRLLLQAVKNEQRAIAAALAATVQAS